MNTEGFFARRLKYVQQRRKNNEEPDLNEANHSHPQDEDAQNEEEDMDYLKRAVISKNNFASVVEKLNATRKLRQQMLLNKETDLREQFPFFFSHPELVS